MKDPGMVPRCQAVLNRTVTYGKETVNLLAERSTSMAFSFLNSFLTIVLVLILSIFLYGTFYYAYIPKDVYKLLLDLQPALLVSFLRKTGVKLMHVQCFAYVE